MADDKKKGEEASDDAPKKKGPLLWIIIASVLGVGGVVGGIFLGPIVNPPPKPTAEDGAASGDGKAEAPAQPSQKSEVPPVIVPWPPFVVDIRDEQGGSRHIKMVITIETPTEATEAELSAFAPRGRQAVLGFVRAQMFEDLTDPAKFESLQKKITELVQASVGKSQNGQERVQ